MAPVAAKNRAAPVLFGASVSPGWHSRARARQSLPGAPRAMQPDGSRGDGPGGPPKIQARLPRPLGPRSPPAARGSPAGPLRPGMHAFPPLLNDRPSQCLWEGPRVSHLRWPRSPAHSWAGLHEGLQGSPSLSAFCDHQDKGLEKPLPTVSQSTRCPKGFLWLDFVGLVIPDHGSTPFRERYFHPSDKHPNH